MEKEGILIVKNDNGVQKEYSILVTFDFNEKSFVIYTDYLKAENGNLKVYASIYDPTNMDDKLLEIKEENEIQVVKDYISQLEEDLKTGIKF